MHNPQHPLLRGALYLAGAALAVVAVVGASCSGSPSADAALATSPPPAQTALATGPLRVDPRNPRYFADASCKAIYLAGSHTWANFQDAGDTSPPPVFDYIAYLDFLQTNHHNFFRLWSWEQAEGAVWTTAGPWFDPMPYARPGPGTALDGKPKYDLARLNQAYFDRMRARIIAAGQRGMYVSVMLFNGWSVMAEQSPSLGNPWPAHPFNAANNVNGVDGDVDHDNSGSDTHTLVNPQVTAYQEAYVRKVIDTVNDLDNVLYEVSNESPDDSIAWQYHMIEYVKAYEATKAQQHPIGMTGRYEWDLNDLLNSNADWISPGGAAFQWEPQANDGHKVIIVDTDHLWGEGGDRAWVWKSFTRGLNVLYMDCYEASFCTEIAPNDPTRLSVVANMGYTQAYAQRMNLAAMAPRGDLCSSQYCLANPAAAGAEYLVYLPSGGMATAVLNKLGISDQGLSTALAPHGIVSVDLSATGGELKVEWLNPQTGAKTPGSPATGGAQRSFTAPFGGDAVLYLYQQVNPLAYDLATPVVGKGSISAHPVGPYTAGQSVTLTATAAAAAKFVGWTGDLLSHANPVSFPITRSMSITATFVALTAPRPYSLTVVAQGEGTVQVDPLGPFYAGQVVTIVGIPAGGWYFKQWAGDVLGNDNPATFVIASNRTVNAQFEELVLTYLPVVIGSQ